ncbi:MAG: short-chain dehydrogenase [Phycisphaerales bacterium]|nr:short-chain dehydrogenase [Phycisphaerales bacterium]MDB5354303.1 short-chain dehydrogenase [Phycisphaerales bacterium]
MTLVASNPDLKTGVPESSGTGNPWVLIVGASSGIGRAVARRWAASGSDVLLAGRDVEDMERSAADLRLRYGRRVEVVPFDALDFDSHESFWRDCLDRTGGDLAGVVMLHGWMPAQADAQNDFTLARKAIDTNYTSAVSLLTLAANDFEKKKRGFLCVFSSVAGDRGRQSNYAYGSAKAALTAFLQGLRNRLFKSGVSVVTVKPGFVDTAMTWGLPGLFLVASPEKVANDVFVAVGKRRAEIYTPFFWRYIMLIIKSVPEFVFKRMKL